MDATFEKVQSAARKLFCKTTLSFFGVFAAALVIGTNDSVSGFIRDLGVPPAWVRDCRRPGQSQRCGAAKASAPEPDGLEAPGLELCRLSTKNLIPLDPGRTPQTPVAGGPLASPRCLPKQSSQRKPTWLNILTAIMWHRR